MIIPDLDWQRPGLLTRGQTKAKYGHWVVPASQASPSRNEAACSAASRSSLPST